MRRLGLGLLAAAVTVTGCASSGPKKDTTLAGGHACSWPHDSSPTSATKPSPPPTAVPDSGMATATLVTTAGTITFTMDKAKTPCTTASFSSLAAQHFFDGTICHRLTTEGIFVLQCGDPTGTGSGGPGYTIPDENLTGATYPAGTVAMANTGRPGTGGSQFFLCYADSPLPPQYTPFGTITAGLDLLKSVGAKGVAGGGTDGAPATPVRITSFTIS